MVVTSQSRMGDVERAHPPLEGPRDAVVGGLEALTGPSSNEPPADINGASVATLRTAWEWNETGD